MSRHGLCFVLNGALVWGSLVASAFIMHNFRGLRPPTPGDGSPPND